MTNFESAESLYQNYSEYNKALRTWFVSFGLGGLVLFMLHPEFVQLLKNTGHFETVVLLFLFGCLFQVLVALLNKFSSWHLYYARRTGQKPSFFGNGLRMLFGLIF